MNSEIVARLGLDETRFEQGLTKAERGWESFRQTLKQNPVDIVPAKSARDSARVFEDIETARQAHIGNLNRDRMESALGQGPGAIGMLSGKSAAISAAVFEKAAEAPASGFAAGFKRVFARKFSLGDALKGMAMGLGIGSVQALGETISGPFQRAMEQAKSMATLTGDLFQNTMRVIGAAGGPRRDFELQKKQLKDVSVEIEFQKSLIDDLNSNPINLFNAEGRQAIRDADQGLNDLLKKQSDIATNLHITTIEENRRTDSIQRQMQLEGELADNQLRHRAQLMSFDTRISALKREYVILQKQGALPSTLQETMAQIQALQNQKAIAAQTMREQFEDVKRNTSAAEAQAGIDLRRGGDMAKSQERLNALRADYDVLIKRNAVSSELETNRSSQRLEQINQQLIRRNALQAKAQTMVDIGEALASGGRTFANGQSRPRSERELIAARGQSFASQAENAVRVGSSPDEVARLVGLAQKDLATAGAAAAQSMSKVDAQSPTIGQLMRANKTLNEINKNLEVEELK